MSATVINAYTRVLGSILVGDPPGSEPATEQRSARSPGDLVIEGIVEGDVRAAGQLTLGRRAQIGGEIRAHDVRIDGVLHRSIRARGVIHLLSTAEVHGDLEAARVIIDDGAIFEGQVRLLRAEPAPRPAPTSNKPQPHSTQPHPTQPHKPQPHKETVKRPVERPFAPPVETAMAAAARPVPELSSPGRRRLQRRAP